MFKAWEVVMHYECSGLVMCTHDAVAHGTCGHPDIDDAPRALRELSAFGFYQRDRWRGIWLATSTLTAPSFQLLATRVVLLMAILST